ncbi:MAG TPA: guanylate kinase [Thiotrichaceae bacterium]|jgi:guanylate kinase|nr:guanylate kinase [Thiotrichaceae bacterium]HIM08648.1 guanylate kinase [Gammaproteobacteria bacterium]
MNNKSGTLFIIAAPSGAGKTSLIKSLISKVDNLDVSISYTTRKPRADEKEGEAYFFVDENEFKELINKNHFLEYAKVFDNYYGTSKSWVDKEMLTGRNFILEIDWQGAQQVKSQLRNSVGIFILPPDYHTLRKRLVGRQNDEQEIIDHRMNAAREEISHYKEFDYIVINDDFEQALSEIKTIIAATNLGSCRQSAFYDDFVGQIMAQKD